MAHAIVMAQAKMELRLQPKAQARLKSARLRQHWWCCAKAALSRLLLWHCLGCGSSQPDLPHLVLDDVHSCCELLGHISHVRHKVTDVRWENLRSHLADGPFQALQRLGDPRAQIVDVRL